MEVIHKISITTEARFDVFECVGLEAFDWRTFKSETEEYITHQAKAGRIPWWGYFRADYIDEVSGRRLKLFFYKRSKIGLMQYWDLAGVCEADDWTQDAEDDGLIRAWLETKIDDLPDEDDWAVRVRVSAKLKQTELTEFSEVLEEVKSEFDSVRDKKEAERLVFLESVFFDNWWRWKPRKRTKRDRTSD